MFSHKRRLTGFFLLSYRFFGYLGQIHCNIVKKEVLLQALADVVQHYKHPVALEMRKS